VTAIDRVDRRYIAGVIFEDATTGAPVRGPLRLSSTNASFFLTTGGVYVVKSALGFEAYVDEFDNPPVVAPVEVEVFITDPAGLYFPRLFTLALPRSLNPTQANAVVQPIRVPLFRSLAAPLNPNWSVIDATLIDNVTGAPVRNALVRALRNVDSVLLGTALLMAGAPDSPTSSPRTIGQLAVPIVGIPVVAWSGTGQGSVLISSVPVRLEIVTISPSLSVFDPSQFSAAAGVSVGPFDVSSGRRTKVAAPLQVTVPS